MTCRVFAILLPLVPLGWIAAPGAAAERDAASATVSLHPPPPGLPESPRYSVEVLVGGTWRKTHVHYDVARTEGLGSGDQPGRTFSWTTFEASAPGPLRVSRRDGPFAAVTIRPARHKIPTKPVGERSVEFTILSP